MVDRHPGKVETCPKTSSGTGEKGQVESPPRLKSLTGRDSRSCVIRALWSSKEEFAIFRISDEKPEKHLVRVGVLAHHPLILAELERRLARYGYEVQPKRLESVIVAGRRAHVAARCPIYVVDASGPDPFNSALVRRILVRNPGSRLLVSAERFTETKAFPLLRQGVRGLLPYADIPRRLTQAVQKVAAGGLWVSRELLSSFFDTFIPDVSERGRFRSRSDLSRREWEVFEALLENQSNKQVAARLCISERTAKFHVTNLLRKFGVRRRDELVFQWLQGGGGEAIQLRAG